MKKTLDIKKLVLLNMPYILLGLFATNFGEAWRMAQGADASEKFLSLVAVLPGALQSFWPSLHPLDLLVGLCCGVGLRLAVYLKSKNAKKYRHGLEYGSARWGTREDDALLATAKKRGTERHLAEAVDVLNEVESSPVMQKLWESYRRKFSYAADLEWNIIMRAVRSLYALSEKESSL